MPDDEKIPSDEKLYPIIWEARNKVCTHIYKNLRHGRSNRQIVSAQNGLGPS